MSGNIRKQLGPVRKRLRDRIDEALLLIKDGDDSRFKVMRPKLFANTAFHDAFIKNSKKFRVLKKMNKSLAMMH